MLLALNLAPRGGFSAYCRLLCGTTGHRSIHRADTAAELGVSVAEVLRGDDLLAGATARIGDAIASLRSFAIRSSGSLSCASRLCLSARSLQRGCNADSVTSVRVGNIEHDFSVGCDRKM